MTRTPAATGHLNGYFCGCNPELASYLTHCRDPKVAEASEARAQELNRTFLEQTGTWLLTQVWEGKVRKLSPPLYHALWMRPSDEHTRLWLLGVSPHDVKQLAKAKGLLDDRLPLFFPLV
jgi:hypothetical protein